MRLLMQKWFWGVMLLALIVVAAAAVVLVLGEVPEIPDSVMGALAVVLPAAGYAAGRRDKK